MLNNVKLICDRISGSQLRQRVKSSRKTHLYDLIKSKILLTVQNLTLSHLYRI